MVYFSILFIILYRSQILLFCIAVRTYVQNVVGYLMRGISDYFNERVFIAIWLVNQCSNRFCNIRQDIIWEGCVIVIVSLTLVPSEIKKNDSKNTAER